MYDISGIQAEHPTRTCGLMKYQKPCTIDRRPRNREIFVAKWRTPDAKSEGFI